VESENDYLIVGLGNPGAKYEKTRHNLGFMVVEALAREYGLSFKRGWRLQGRVAGGVVEGKNAHLLMPTTYMNLSGRAVQKALHYYKIFLGHLVIVVDDVYVKFGAMRFRGVGSAGGHNGLKNIEACVGTPEYPRLRMGVGPKNGKNLPDGQEMALEEYVLANFTPDECQELPKVVENGALVVKEWLKLGVEAASSLAGNISKLGNNQ
jgi:peptidyl-tRNA hydrolase, PTH1 family